MIILKDLPTCLCLKIEIGVFTSAKKEEESGFLEAYLAFEISIFYLNQAFYNLDDYFYSSISRYMPYDHGPSPQSEYSFRPIAHRESPSKESKFLPDPDRSAHCIPPRNYDPTQLSRPYDRGPPYQQQQPRVFNPPPYGAKQYLVWIFVIQCFFHKH